MAEIRADGIDKLVRKLKQTAQAQIRKDTRDLLTRAGKWAVGEMTHAVTRGGPDGLRSRTGQLRRTLGFEVQRSESATQLEMGARKFGGAAAKALKYAKVHEYGATINAKPGKALTIPLPPALTPAGVAKFTAREAFDKFEGVRIITSKKGNVLIVREKGRARVQVVKGEKRKVKPLEALFLLVKQVTIPARPYVRPAGANAVKAIKEKLPAIVAGAILRGA